MNRLTNTRFIAIKHWINSCENYRQLETITETVFKYVRTHKDGADLLNYFDTKRNQLKPTI